MADLFGHAKRIVYQASLQLSAWAERMLTEFACSADLPMGSSMTLPHLNPILNGTLTPPAWSRVPQPSGCQRPMNNPKLNPEAPERDRANASG